MKKLLLVTTALVGVTMMSAQASAAVKMGLGGYFSGYGVYADNNDPAGTSDRSTDIRSDREIFFTGSTTLDNGLTVGINYELDLGGVVLTDEAYAYFSGGWGRVNVGAEDGSAFLLQVAAPSADANVDGMQVTMQAFGSEDALFDMTTNGLGMRQLSLLDYEHATSPIGLNSADRLTYLTPKFSGFQAGVSYAPQDIQAQGQFNNIQPMANEDVDTYEDIWEASARWDGEFQGFGIGLGGGYSHAALQTSVGAVNALAGSTVVVVGGVASTAAPVVSDGLTTWNAGMNLAWNGFSLGGSYLRANTEMVNGLDLLSTGNVVDSVDSLDVDQTTWTVGLGYDNGPYHLGGSYLTSNLERDASGSLAADDGALAAIDADVHRYTVGAGYTFGPGMTFNGAIAWGEFDNSTGSSDAANVDKVGFAGSVGLPGLAATNNDFTQVTIGTNIQF